MLGQRCSPLLVQCRSIVYNARPTLIHHRVCCILYANTCHSPDAASMLTHGLSRWLVIETALGDCIIFSVSCIMRVTLFVQVPETTDDTIHWPNSDVMLGHCLRRWANVIPAKTFWALNHKYKREYIFFSEDLLKTKVLNLRT